MVRKSTQKSARKSTRQSAPRWRKTSAPKQRTVFATAMRKLSRLRPPQRVEAMKLANKNYIRQFSNNVKSQRRARVSSRKQKRLLQSTNMLHKLMSRKTSIRAKRFSPMTLSF